MLGTDDYVNKYVGLVPSAVEYLLGQGIKMMGIDTIGLDRPCFLMFKEFLTTKDKSPRSGRAISSAAVGNIVTWSDWEILVLSQSRLGLRFRVYQLK